MVKEINYTRPDLKNYQREIIDCPSRYTVTLASTKVGKTFSHSVWLFEQALKLRTNQNVWWVAPVYGQAEMVFKRIRSQIGANFFKANESNLTLTLPVGSVMTFKSAEKPDNLYGDDVHAVVFDEFTRAREESFFALRSTLTYTKGKMKLIGNVKGKKNWGYRMALKAQAGEQDYSYFKIDCYDAEREGLITMDEINQAKRDLPDHVFKELFLAEPSEDGSNPFGLAHIRNSLGAITGNKTICFGVDLAKSTDYTVITGLDQLGNTSYFERFQMDWKQTRERVIAVCKGKPCAIDSTGVGDPIVEDIQRAMPNVEGFHFNSNSKQQLMEGLASALQQGKIKIIAGIMQNELESFEYEYTRTGVRYTAPSGLHDDAVCSLALAWYKFSNRGTGRYVIG